MVFLSSVAAADPGDVPLPDISLLDSTVVSAAPTPTVGEVREFNGRVAGVDCSRWVVTQLDVEGFLVSECGTYKSYFARGDHYNLHKLTDGSGATILEFDPAYPGLEFPLQAGRRWERTYTGYAASEDLHWDGDVSCEVADFGEVEVAAGRFKAFRIECHDHWKVAGVESSVNSTTWYAPDARGIVRTINYEDPRWNTELRAFHP